MSSEMPVKFLCDRMLGSLARWLRMAGFDAEYASMGPDSKLTERAVAEGRILLTRDAKLAAKTPGSLLVRSKDFKRQLGEVLAKHQLDEERLMTRCSDCNGMLAQAGPDDGMEGVPADVIMDKRPVWKCGKCGKHYWKGSHWPGILSTLRNARK